LIRALGAGPRPAPTGASVCEVERTPEISCTSELHAGAAVHATGLLMPIGIWAATDHTGSSRLALSSAMASIGDLDQQALVAHSRQVKVRNTDVGDVTRADRAQLASQGDRTLSE
jgi:hypothetical protein